MSSGNLSNRRFFIASQSERSQSERGQTTAEYALVLLAAGTIAMLVVSWAQGNDAIGGLFDAVISKVTSLIA